MFIFISTPELKFFSLLALVDKGIEAIPLHDKNEEVLALHVKCVELIALYDKGLDQDLQNLKRDGSI